jgi:hypothetical protein
MFIYACGEGDQLISYKKSRATKRWTEKTKAIIKKNTLKKYRCGQTITGRITEANG